MGLFLYGRWQCLPDLPMARGFALRTNECIIAQQIGRPLTCSLFHESRSAMRIEII
jgi:hypothetical protein